MFVKHALSLKSEALKMFLNVSLEKHVFKSKKGAYLLRKKRRAKQANNDRSGPGLLGLRPEPTCMGWDRAQPNLICCADK